MAVDRIQGCHLVCHLYWVHLRNEFVLLGVFIPFKDGYYPIKMCLFGALVARLRRIKRLL